MTLEQLLGFLQGAFPACLVQTESLGGLPTVLRLINHDRSRYVTLSLMEFFDEEFGFDFGTVMDELADAIEADWCGTTPE